MSVVTNRAVWGVRAIIASFALEEAPARIELGTVGPPVGAACTAVMSRLSYFSASFATILDVLLPAVLDLRTSCHIRRE